MTCIVLQGAFIGLVVSTLAMFWIVIGSFMYEIPMPTLPFSTSGCAERLSSEFAYNRFTSRVYDLVNVVPVTVATTLSSITEM